MVSAMERRIICQWEKNRKGMIEKLKSNYSNIFDELNNKAVEYFYFTASLGGDYFRIHIKTNNSFNDYLIFGYDLIPLCNLIGIKFDIDKILSGYEFHKKFV